MKLCRSLIIIFFTACTLDDLDRNLAPPESIVAGPSSTPLANKILYENVFVTKDGIW